MSSLKEQFFAADDLVAKPVDFAGVPGWESVKGIHVRVMTGRERNDWECYTIRFHGDQTVLHREDVWAKLAVLTVCDAKGQRLFDDRDLAAVTKKSSFALKRIYDAAVELNLLTGEPKGDDPNSRRDAGSDSSATSPGSGDAASPNSSPAATPAN